MTAAAVAPQLPPDRDCPADATPIRALAADREVDAGKSTIYRLIGEGKLASHRVDGAQHVSRSELIAALAEHRTVPRHLRALTAADREAARRFGQRAAARAPEMSPGAQRVAAVAFERALAGGGSK